MRSNMIHNRSWCSKDHPEISGYDARTWREMILHLGALQQVWNRQSMHHSAGVPNLGKLANHLQSSIVSYVGFHRIDTRTSWAASASTSSQPPGWLRVLAPSWCQILSSSCDPQGVSLVLLKKGTPFGISKIAGMNLNLSKYKSGKFQRSI